MGLFAPAWMKTKNEKAALQAIEKITDEAKLISAAVSAPLLRVRVAAIRKIHNQPFLYSLLEALGKTEGLDDMVQPAMDNLKDTKLLTQLACRQNNYYKIIIGRIRDMNILRTVVFQGEDVFAKCEAVRCMNRDPEELLQVMEKSPISVCRETAQRILNDNYMGSYNGVGREELKPGQFKRYINALINDPEKVDYGFSEQFRLPQKTDDETLWRVYRECPGLRCRIGAVSQLIPRLDTGKLMELGGEIDEYIRKAEKEAPREAKDWRGVKDKIGETLARKNSGSPEQLLQNIRNTGLGIQPAISGVRQLFSSKLDDMEGIGEIRDQAVRFILNNITSYDGVADKTDPYLFNLAISLPEETTARYGFSVSECEVEDEDAFGRYTYTRKDVYYHGKYLAER